MNFLLFPSLFANLELRMGMAKLKRVKGSYNPPKKTAANNEKGKPTLYVA